MADETAVGIEPVTVESDGRIFSGVGVSPESLAETMDAREKPATPTTEAPRDTSAHAAVAPPSERETAEPSALDRNEDGTFRKAPKGNRRYAALTADRVKAEEAANAEKSRADALEARLKALEAARTGGTDTEAARTARTPEPPATPQGRQKPTADEIGAKYQTYEDFLEDLADWKLEQRLAADVDGRIQQRFEQEHAQTAIQQRLLSLGAEGRAAYPDWVETFAQYEGQNDIQFPPATYQAIVTAPNAAHLVYTLAKDRRLAQAVAQERDPLRLGIMLGSVRPSAPVARPASTPQTVASSAPAPYQPVGSGSKTTTPTASELAQSGSDDYDASGYRERRAAERKGVRR